MSGDLLIFEIPLGRFAVRQPSFEEPIPGIVESHVELAGRVMLPSS